MDNTSLGLTFIVNPFYFMEVYMSKSVLNKLLKKQREKEKYSFISTEDLEKMKNRGLELSKEIENTNFMANPLKFKELSLELYSILHELKMYEKYAKKD